MFLISNLLILYLEKGCYGHTKFRYIATCKVQYIPKWANFFYDYRDVDVMGISSLNISGVESIRCAINPEFGMHEGDLSSSCSSDSSLSEDSLTDTAR